jgi:hypothetical protein
MNRHVRLTSGSLGSCSPWSQSLAHLNEVRTDTDPSPRCDTFPENLKLAVVLSHVAFTLRLETLRRGEHFRTAERTECKCPQNSIEDSASDNIYAISDLPRIAEVFIDFGPFPEPVARLRNTFPKQTRLAFHGSR